MSFIKSLQSAAAASGMKEVQGEVKKTENVVAADKSAFGAMLQTAKSSPAVKSLLDSVPTTELGSVDTWSFSTLKTFETCQWSVKLDKIDRIPQESGEAADRGSLVHDGCEEWVRFERDELPADAKTRFDYFTRDFERLREAFREGRVLMEENWGIRQDWSPCAWNPENPEENDPELWGKAKLDVFLIETAILKNGVTGYVAFNNKGELVLKDGRKKPKLWDDLPLEVRANYSVTATVIDHKTGRKFGNEMKHSDQGLSYALHVMYRYPDINAVEIEFWYLDQADKLRRMFNRRQLLLLHRMYHTRAMKLTCCTNFMPSPNAHTCMFCSYGANKNKAGKPYGNGACQYDHYRGFEHGDT